MSDQGNAVGGLMGRSNNFDALRVLLALTVLFSHCFGLVERTVTWLNPVHLTRGQSLLGDIAVNGFFLISGFLITASWMRSRGIVDYLRRRILRIYPGFVVSALLCLLVVGPWAAPSVAEYFGKVDLVKRLIGVATLSKMENLPTFLNNPMTGEVNGSLWTIRIEFECYLLVPILGWLGFLRRPPMMVALAAVVYGAHAAMSLDRGLFPEQFWDYDARVRFGTYFLFGAVLHLYRDRLVFPKWSAWACAAALILSGQLGGFKVVEPFALSWLLLWLAQANAPWATALTRRADLSYGIYLYAWPVKQLLVWQFGPTLNPYALFAMTTPITAVLAAASWFAVEKPFLRSRAKRSEPGGESPPPSAAPAA